MDFYAEIAAESHTPFLLKSFIVEFDRVLNSPLKLTKSNNLKPTRLTFACSKSVIETPEKGVKYVQN